MKKREIITECRCVGKEDPKGLICMAWDGYLRRILAEKYNLKV